VLKHQPCCRAVLAKKQNKKIIHKTPVLEPFPPKSSRGARRGSPHPRLCKTAGPPVVVPWVPWFGAGAAGFPPGASIPPIPPRPIPSHPIPSHPIPGRAGGPQRPPALHGCRHPRSARLQRRERRTRLVQGSLERVGADGRCRVKNSQRGVIR